MKDYAGWYTVDFFNLFWDFMNLFCILIPSTIVSYFRWVQAECKKLGDTDNPEVGELLKKAVRCLKERPVLFKYCAEEV